MKSNTGRIFAHHLSNVDRMIRKIDHLRKLKIEQERHIDNKDFSRARSIEEQIYELESQDELDVIASYAGDNQLGRVWTF